MARFRQQVFPALALAAYIVFLALDLTRAADATWVKFAAVCLCCAAALAGAKTPDARLVAAALCFTVGADWFLLVRDDHYPLGVALFLVVQFLYACRLYRLRGGRVCPWGLALRLAALVLALLLLALTLWAFRASLTTFTHPPEGVIFHLPAFLSFLLSSLAAAVSPVLLPTLLYFANLCVNAAEAFALAYAPDPGKAAGASSRRLLRRFAWGLLLFACCDACVGGWNLAALLPAALQEFTRVGMWFFYLPSQVLLVLSQDTKGALP